jgi:hypothetical protein
MDAGEGLVLLTHGIVKKQQKTKRADVDKALIVLGKYISAKRGNDIEIQDLEQ